MSNSKRKTLPFAFLFASTLLISCNQTTTTDNTEQRGEGDSPSSVVSKLTKSEEKKKTWDHFHAVIEISQIISDDFKLYLKGSWDNYTSSTLLNKISTFQFEGDVTASIDSTITYNYYVLINDDSEYQEHILNEKDNQIKFSSSEDEITLSHKVMDFDGYPQNENQWSILNGPTSNVTETENGIKIENYSWQSGFVCKANTLGEKNYTMSAHFKGTKSSPYTDETYIGFVPYYFDSSNYLFAYVQWCNWEGYQTVVREIGITGYINGVSAGWNDILAPSNITTSPATGFTLTMERTSTGFTATFLGDDGLTFSGSRSFSNLKKGSDYLGIYVQNDVVEVTDYQVKEK